MNEVVAYALEMYRAPPVMLAVFAMSVVLVRVTLLPETEARAIAPPSARVAVLLWKSVVEMERLQEGARA